MIRRAALVRMLALGTPVLITTVLWLMSKTRFEAGWEIRPLQALSQITSLWALTLFSIVLLISARSRTIEKLYGGLDKSYRMHGTLAKVALALAVVHLLLLAAHHWGDVQQVKSLFVPGDFWPKNFAIAGLYLLLVLVAITVFRFQSYQPWLATHKLAGLAVVFSGVHALGANSDIRSYEPLRTWALLLIAAGGIAWIYKSFLYPFVAQRFDYQVAQLRSMGAGISELHLWPVSKRMNYEPGEFAFISVTGQQKIPGELHPFSIASNPARSGLRFSFKEAGDYTRQLKSLKPGDTVQVLGPYGEFTSYMLYEFKHQIWIAGGIGVTPFLSMLAYEGRNQDVKDIWMFYSTKRESESVYHEEIEQLVADANDRTRYVQHIGERDGRLTAKLVRDQVGDLSQYAVLLCGPPAMMNDLKKQFIALGVPASRIFFEDFSFV